MSSVNNLPKPLTSLVRQLSRLPGIGTRSAQRMAFHILKMSDDEVAEIANALLSSKRSLIHCPICGNYTDITPCSVCADDTRDSSVVCVVTTASDVFSIESMQEYNGTYHVLGGTLSPLDGVGPSDINIDSLIKRVECGGIDEVILATNPDVEGEATASYIAGKLKPFGIRVTRLAYGLPMGGNLEYVDSMTLSLALTGRRDV